MIILIGLAAFISTYLGGLFALRFKDKLHLVLGFSAGAVIGVAFFDLLPEAINLSGGFHSVETVTTIVAVGFVMYLILDRLIGANVVDVNSGEITRRGKLGAASLSIHSLLDGVAVGLAFQASATIGAVVTAAVLVHDFSDGINTVNLVLKNNGERKDAFKWLLWDAVAPIIGVISTMFFSLPQSALGFILALFSGFFLYIGASDLLPESHHNHPTLWTTGMTILGIGVLFTVIYFANL